MDDLRFLRRAYLDTVGVVPSEAQVRSFAEDAAPDKRERLIARLLEDPRWADHWMGYWQDSFYVASDSRMNVEEMTIDPDGRRFAASRNTFSKPHPSWMLVSLSNERDRPSLTFPYAAMVEEALTAFGWSADRQSPTTERDQAPNVRQPAVIANSHLTLWLTSAPECIWK